MCASMCMEHSNSSRLKCSDARDKDSAPPYAASPTTPNVLSSKSFKTIKNQQAPHGHKNPTPILELPFKRSSHAPISLLKKVAPQYLSATVCLTTHQPSPFVRHRKRAKNSTGNNTGSEHHKIKQQMSETDISRLKFEGSLSPRKNKFYNPEPDVILSTKSDITVSVFKCNTNYAQYQTHNESTNLENIFIFLKKVVDKFILKYNPISGIRNKLVELKMRSCEEIVDSQICLKYKNISHCVYCNMSELPSFSEDNNQCRIIAAKEIIPSIGKQENMTPNNQGPVYHDSSPHFTMNTTSVKSKPTTISVTPICDLNQTGRLPENLTKHEEVIQILKTKNKCPNIKYVNRGPRKLDSIATEVSIHKYPLKKSGSLSVKISCQRILVLSLMFLLAGSVCVKASEFPDRECCDSVPPPPPHYHSVTSTTTSTPPPHQLRYNTSISVKKGEYINE